MKRSIPVTLVTLSALSLAAIVLAGPDRPGPPPPGHPGMAAPGPHGGMKGPPGEMHPVFGEPHGPGGHWLRIVEKLDLSPEQRDRLRSLRLKFRNETRKTRFALAALEDEQQAMLIAGKVDMERLANMDDDILKLRTEMMRARMAMQRERLQVLNEDQIKKLTDLMGGGDKGPLKRGFPPPERERFFKH